MLGALLLLALALCQPASAAGVDCSRADWPTGHTVCSDPQLSRLDAVLARRYAAMVRLAGKNLATLQAEQRAWIRSQVACRANTDCLGQRYRERLVALHPPLDKTDEQALEALRGEVERQRRVSAEFALERAIDALSIRQGVTNFANQRPVGEDLDTDALRPVRRPAGVSPAEWKAVLTVASFGDNEHGHVSYELLDVDGDGQRELIVDEYVGGTGLFNYVTVQPLSGSAKAWPADEALFSLNGRGSHQYAQWVRLAGRVYAAWVNGHFGRDQVYLLRPLHPGSPALSLGVHYEYDLHVTGRAPDDERGAQVAISSFDKTALDKALKVYSDGLLRGPAADSKPLCPPREGAEDDRSFGPGHYSFEVVGEQPVWIEGQCHFAQLIDWFGRYDQGGLHAQLRLRRPGEEREAAYEVAGRRRLVRIEVEPAKVPGR